MRTKNRAGLLEVHWKATATLDVNKTLIQQTYILYIFLTMYVLLDVDLFNIICPNYYNYSSSNRHIVLGIFVFLNVTSKDATIPIATIKSIKSIKFTHPKTCLIYNMLKASLLRCVFTKLELIIAKLEQDGILNNTTLWYQ